MSWVVGSLKGMYQRVSRPPDDPQEQPEQRQGQCPSFYCVVEKVDVPLTITVNQLL